MIHLRKSPIPLYTQVSVYSCEDLSLDPSTYFNEEGNKIWTIIL